MITHASDAGRAAPPYPGIVVAPVAEPTGTFVVAGSLRHRVASAEGALMSVSTTSTTVLEPSPGRLLLNRAVPADLVIDGRTLVGIAVPFGRVATVADSPRGPRYQEAFRRGAFARTIAEQRAGVRSFAQHDTARLPIGRTSHLVEESAGLEAHIRVSNTSTGNDVLALVRDGVLSGLSVGFTALRHVMEAGVTVRTEARLREISVVAEPAFDDARISGIRSTPQPVSRLAIARRRLLILELECL